MPELPDVENMRTRIESRCLRRRVASVEVLKSRLVRESRKSIYSIEGGRFKKTYRHGKNLFVMTDGGDILAMHFGMTGDVACGKAGQQRPEYAAVVFGFEDGGFLAVTSRRLLGRVGVINSIEDYLEGRDIGPDALQVTLEQFARMLKRRSSLKGLLMNQSLLAGIGNIYSDEILFHAKMRPVRNASELDGGDAVRLYKAMRKVLRTASERGAQPDRLPRTWLLPHRDKKQKCPRCGTELKTSKASGRTCWYCPKCQK